MLSEPQLSLLVDQELHKGTDVRRVGRATDIDIRARAARRRSPNDARRERADIPSIAKTV